MTTPEPTAEHIDAVARVLDPNGWEAWRVEARAILTDPDAQAALVANLPREVMIASLVADGTLLRAWKVKDVDDRSEHVMTDYDEACALADDFDRTQPIYAGVVLAPGRWEAGL